jgi:hypothetical protein
MAASLLMLLSVPLCEACADLHELVSCYMAATSLLMLLSVPLCESCADLTPVSVRHSVQYTPRPIKIQLNILSSSVQTKHQDTYTICVSHISHDCRTETPSVQDLSKWVHETFLNISPEWELICLTVGHLQLQSKRYKIKTHTKITYKVTDNLLPCALIA